jgi:hypothetical protein
MRGDIVIPLIQIIILIASLLTAPKVEPVAEIPSLPPGCTLDELLDPDSWPPIDADLPADPVARKDELRRRMLAEFDKIAWYQAYLGDDLPPCERMDVDEHRRMLREGDIDGVLRVLGSSQVPADLPSQPPPQQ